MKDDGKREKSHFNTPFEAYANRFRYLQRNYSNKKGCMIYKIQKIIEKSTTDLKWYDTNILQILLPDNNVLIFSTVQIFRQCDMKHKKQS